MKTEDQFSTVGTQSAASCITDFMSPTQTLLAVGPFQHCIRHEAEFVRFAQSMNYATGRRGLEL